MAGSPFTAWTSRSLSPSNSRPRNRGSCTRSEARKTMTSFLIGTAGFVLGMAALGLIGIFVRPGETDRLMAAQLLGTDSIAGLLLLSITTETPSIVDVALMLALLAAFAAVAFVRSATSGGESNVTEEGTPMNILINLFTVLAVVTGAFFFLAGT